MTKQQAVKFADLPNSLLSSDVICVANAAKQFVPIAALHQQTHSCQTSGRKIENRTSASSANDYLPQLPRSNRQHSSLNNHHHKHSVVLRWCPLSPHQQRRVLKSALSRTPPLLLLQNIVFLHKNRCRRPRDPTLLAEVMLKVSALSLA